MYDAWIEVLEGRIDALEIANLGLKNDLIRLERRIALLEERPGEPVK